MKDITVPNYSDWVYPFRCDKCGTEAIGDANDLHTASFKVSGYHFAGTAVCEDKFYFLCPNPICGDFTYVFVDTDQIPTGLRLQTRALRNDDA